MNSVKKIKKYSYLLLELLIAITLLSLFLAPMLQAPFSYMKKQKEEIISLFLRLQGEKLLIKVEEDLRTGQISWDTLIKSQREKIAVPYEGKVSFPDKTFPKIEAKIYLSKSYLKKLETGTWIGTVQATLEFFQKKTKRPIYKTNATFFVSKKILQIPVPPLPPVKNSICLEGGKK